VQGTTRKQFSFSSSDSARGTARHSLPCFNEPFPKCESARRPDPHAAVPHAMDAKGKGLTPSVSQSFREGTKAASRATKYLRKTVLLATVSLPTALAQNSQGAPGPGLPLGVSVGLAY